MSMYGLIKASSKAQRVDTIHDLHIINKFRYAKGLNGISPYGQSVRAIENSVSLALWQMDTLDLPTLIRSKSFYLSLLSEIKEKERNKYNLINKNTI